MAFPPLSEQALRHIEQWIPSDEQQGTEAEARSLVEDAAQRIELERSCYTAALACPSTAPAAHTGSPPRTGYTGHDRLWVSELG
jgi:hypothetical protein